MRNIFIFFISVYQKTISRVIPPCCRFVPTCSEYAKIALRKKGLFRGGLLIVWRLLRCHPFCRGGVDTID